MVVTKGGKKGRGRRVENVHILRSSLVLDRQIDPKSGITKRIQKKAKPRQLNSDVSGIGNHNLSL